MEANEEGHSGEAALSRKSIALNAQEEIHHLCGRLKAASRVGGMGGGTLFEEEEISNRMSRLEAYLLLLQGVEGSRLVQKGKCLYFRKGKSLFMKISYAM